MSTRWVKLVVGLFLLIPAGLLTQTVFVAYSRVAGGSKIWLTEEFWCCGLGAALWVCWFFGSIWTLGEPRPLRAYVFAHELTHAVWVWLMGGKVSEFESSRKGGYIVTNKSNFWIALTPYFYPLYTLVVIVLFSIAGIFYDVTSDKLTVLWGTGTVSNWMFVLIGATWAFHFSFTCWMIPKGQSDLRSHGTFFSLVVIYIANVLMVALFVIVAVQRITFGSFARDLLINTENFSAWAVNVIESTFSLVTSGRG